MMISSILDKLRKKLKINEQYLLRKASEDDIQFILQELTKGAEQGHFTKAFLDKKERSNYRTMFSNLIKGIGFITATEHGYEAKSGSLWIFHSSQSLEKIGYLFISERFVGSGENDLELLIAGIHEEHQGKGYGEKMLKELLEMIPSNSNVYARCFKSSVKMVNLLTKFNFSVTNVRPTGTKEMELTRG